MRSTGGLEEQIKQEVTPTESTRSGRYYRPDVDILELADELIVLVDVPGLKADDIDIQFESGTFSITGETPLRQPANTQYLSQEYGIGGFHRRFQISEVIDASRITADCGHGVLTVHLPKAEAAKPKKIEVRAR
jgi:HSP20 family molecular chaperone IbpA